MNHLKRIHEYNKDRYPYLSRLAVGAIMWFELYFIVILNQGVTWDTIRPVLGYREAIGAFTLFCFLWWLRIADDLKDEETDKVLFPDRALPTGRITRKELQWFCVPLIAIPLILNLIFMPNRWFCLFLYTYGSLMAVWFFQKHKIQPNLPAALFTHNPVQIVMNLYTLSYVVMVYGLKWVSLTNFLAIFTLYFPALIWEVSRKIRAPKDETDYVTYSKLFGYKRATNFVLIVTWIDIITNFILVWNLSKLSVGLLLLLVSWMTWKFLQFKKDPEKWTIVSKVETYTFLQEGTMILTIVLFLIFGYIGW